MRTYAIATDAHGTVVDAMIGTNLERWTRNATAAGLTIETHPAPTGMTNADLEAIAWPSDPNAARTTIATVVIR